LPHPNIIDLGPLALELHLAGTWAPNSKEVKPNSDTLQRQNSRFSLRCMQFIY
jgi:hypothetical protein